MTRWTLNIARAAASTWAAASVPASSGGRIWAASRTAAPTSVSYRIWDLSASLPLGSGRVLAGMASRTTGGNMKRQVVTLGYVHDLSRRTDLSAMWILDRTKTRTLPAPPTVPSARGSSFGVGLRHRF